MRRLNIIFFGIPVLFFSLGFNFSVLAKENFSKYVSFSSEEILQGDTLLIKIKKEAGIAGVFGNFLSKKIDFFKTIDGDWIGFSGFSPKKPPGKYNLVLNFSAGAKFSKIIKVNKRYFPITKLLVTEDLKNKGYSPSSILQFIGDDTAVLTGALNYYSPTAFFTRSFVYPLLKIESVGDFGDIRKNKGTVLQHLGVDLEAEEGTPVYAANDGVVCFVGELKNYGKTVAINHGLGIFSLYLHLNEFKVSNAQLIKRGDIVGLSGNTGYSIAPHLHFSIHVNGASIDPLVFIETTIFEMPD